MASAHGRFEPLLGSELTLLALLGLGSGFGLLGLGGSVGLVVALLALWRGFLAGDFLHGALGHGAEGGDLDFAVGVEEAGGGVPVGLGRG